MTVRYHVLAAMFTVSTLLGGCAMQADDVDVGETTQAAATPSVELAPVYDLPVLEVAERLTAEAREQGDLLPIPGDVVCVDGLAARPGDAEQADRGDLVLLEDESCEALGEGTTEARHRNQDTLANVPDQAMCDADGFCLVERDRDPTDPIPAQPVWDCMAWSDEADGYVHTDCFGEDGSPPIVDPVNP